MFEAFCIVVLAIFWTPVTVDFYRNGWRGEPRS